MTIKLRIPSISCMGCVKRIENLLKGINGIENFKVELSTKTAIIEGEFEKSEIFEKLKEIGYPQDKLSS